MTGSGLTLSCGVAVRCGWATTTTSPWGAPIQVTAPLTCASPAPLHSPLCLAPPLLPLLLSAVPSSRLRAPCLVAAAPHPQLLATCSHGRLSRGPALEALHDEGPRGEPPRAARPPPAGSTLLLLCAARARPWLLPCRPFPLACLVTHRALFPTCVQRMPVIRFEDHFKQQRSFVMEAPRLPRPTDDDDDAEQPARTDQVSLRRTLARLCRLAAWAHP